MRIDTGVGVLWGVMGRRLWVKIVYGVDWWTRVMGQSPNGSHGLERNENKYKCVRHSKWGRSPPPPRVKDPNVIHG